MSDWTSEELVALRKLVKKAQEDPDFTEEDVKVLKKFTETIRGLTAFGRFAKWIVFIFAAIAGFLTTWDQLSDRIRSWLAG